MGNRKDAGEVNLKTMAFGYDNLMADIIYLWSLQYYTDFSRDTRLPYLLHTYDVITDLDPQYIDAYMIGALIIVAEGQDMRAAIPLLNKATPERLPVARQVADRLLGEPRIGRVLIGAVQEEPPVWEARRQVGALVLDGCFATVHNMVVNQAALLGIPEFLVDFFNPGVFLISRLFYDFELVDVQDVIADVACPIFFIHEENDELVSREEVELLFSLATYPANQFWEVAGADHSQSYKTHPAEYIERVDAFLDALE